MHTRVKLQDGIRGHFHDHDDGWMIAPDRLAKRDDTE